MISRRTLLAGLLLRPGKLNLGIGTYSYHGLSMDAMIVQLQRLEIREIEMSRGEFMLFSKPNPEQFAAARAKYRIVFDLSFGRFPLPYGRGSEGVGTSIAVVTG